MPTYDYDVVSGGANYSSVAPAHSFINVEDFPSPKELAKDLLYLDSNATAYEEYFGWRREYKVVSNKEQVTSDGIWALGGAKTMSGLWSHTPAKKIPDHRPGGTGGGTEEENSGRRPPQKN